MRRGSPDTDAIWQNVPHSAAPSCLPAPPSPCSAGQTPIPPVPHYKCHGLRERPAEPTGRRLTGGAHASGVPIAKYLDQGDALLVQLRGSILPQAGIEAAQQLHPLHNGHSDVPRPSAVHAHQVLAGTLLMSGLSGARRAVLLLCCTLW